MRHARSLFVDGRLWRRVAVLLALAAPLAPPSRLFGQEHAFDAPRPRGGRVGWARLQNSSPHWKRHARSDDVLYDFIRANTSLNLDPTWYAADPASIEQLAAYPLIFTNDLTSMRNAASRRNLGEYLRRGGFLIVDGCVNTDVTPDPDRFIAENREALLSIVPGGAVRELPRDHELYACYFQLTKRPVHAQRRPYKEAWIRHGLYGVWDRERRMVAVLGVSGLQCGWDGFGEPGGVEESLRTIVNIYVYAMTRSASP